MAKKSINNYAEVRTTDVCSLLFDQESKPEHYLMCKAINVYDDKYRINVYSKRWIEDIEGKYISASYFAKLSNNGSTLTILRKETSSYNPKQRDRQ